MKNTIAASKAAPGDEMKSRRRARPDPVTRTREMVQGYFEALNAWDLTALGGLLSPELVHDIDSVERRLGREAYLAFLADRARAYREHAFDIQIMVNADGSRASAEYTLLGFPLSDAATGQEPDTSQTYRISSGLFFQIDGGRIQRISQHSPSPQLG